jgi:hypothetical protein
MQGVVVESGAMRADVTDAADMAIAKTSQMFAASHAADMGSAAKASDMAAAKAAAPAATTTASLGSARHQARSEKSCCQHGDHPFHRDTPFQVRTFGVVTRDADRRGRNVG